MATLPQFILFPDPLRENVIEESSDRCDICDESRGWMYCGPVYVEGDEPSVCPWCIASGKAAEQGITFNDGVQYPFLPHTFQLSPQELTLVEDRTPGFNAWQGNHWLACCGKACVYLGEAGSADLLGRWAAAVPSIFDVQKQPQSAIEDMVRAIRKGEGPCAYVFQCRECKKLCGYSDCD